MIADEHVFESREALALQLAQDVAAVLKTGSTLAVSGGTTPKLFFEKLSQMDAAWADVTVTLVDERLVPESHERSNARLVRAFLMQNKAAAARFMPISASVPPLDVVILGLGNDGHTASFFPGGDKLMQAIDPATAARVIEINAPGAGEPRLTFTLPVLMAAKHVMLHIEGPEKRAVLDRALEDGPVEDMPIRAVLRAATPLTVYWSRRN